MNSVNVRGNSSSSSIFPKQNISHDNTQMMSQHEQSMAKLKAEMKLLRWHKLANESALQTALIRTRQMRRHDEAMKPATINAEQREKAERIQQAIEEELAKPLEVDKEFMDKYQKEEARDKKILSQQIERRMQALENVKGVIEQRQAVKSRQEECRAIQSYVQQQKKTVELERRKERKKRSRSRVDSKLSKLNSSGRNRPVTVNNDDQQEIDSSDNLQLKSTSNVVGDQDQGNLPSILRSLDQLVVLESRIKSLEENNLHQNLMREGAISDPSIMRKIPSMKTRSVSNRNGSHFSSSSIPQRGSSVQLSFSKRHTHSQPKNPSRPYYTASVLPPSRANSARPSLESNQHNITQRPLTVGARLREARTFLTQIPRGTNKNAFSGKRYSTPIAESDRFMTRNHHNLLGKENIRVNDPTNRIQKGKSKIQIKKTTRGSHLGIKTSNPHLREFHRIREEHLKRKDIIQKQSASMLASSRTYNRNTNRGYDLITRTKRSTGSLPTKSKSKSHSSLRAQSSSSSMVLGSSLRKSHSSEGSFRTGKQTSISTLPQKMSNRGRTSVQENNKSHHVHRMQMSYHLPSISSYVPARGTNVIDRSSKSKLSTVHSFRSSSAKLPQGWT